MNKKVDEIRKKKKRLPWVVFFYYAHHHFDWRTSDLDPAIDFQKKFQHMALRPHDVKKVVDGGAQENLSVKIKDI